MDNERCLVHLGENKSRAGAMAVRVTDLYRPPPVAIKVLPPELASLVGLARFLHGIDLQLADGAEASLSQTSRLHVVTR